jgi:hypothetical protein
MGVVASICMGAFAAALHRRRCSGTVGHLPTTDGPPVSALTSAQSTTERRADIIRSCNHPSAPIDMWLMHRLRT